MTTSRCSFVLVALLVPLVVARSDTKLGVSSQIYGGASCSLAPWHVQILSQSVTQAASCAGSLISSEWVLTAAHCVQGFTSFTVRAGTLTCHTGGSVYVVTQAVVHQDFNPANRNHDIAVLRVNPITFVPGVVEPIKLVPEERCCEFFGDLQVSGCGQDSLNCSYPVQLQCATLLEVKNADCFVPYGFTWIIPGKMCAASLQLNVTPCDGDNGAALVRLPDLVSTIPLQLGIVSFFPPSGCNSGYATGFTRVCAYLDWLRAVTLDGSFGL